MAVLLPPSEVTAQTIASYQKQRNPVAYSSMVKKVTGRVKHLQEELAAESATNIEFEESSRRSFEFLSGQVKALKGAFNTLTDTLLEELEHMSSSVRSEISRVDARQSEIRRYLEEGLSGQKAFGERLSEQCDAQQRQLGDATARLEHRFEQLAADLETVLGVVPKIEDAMLRGDGALQEKVAAVAHEVSALSREVERVDDLVSGERSRVAATTERLDAKIKGAAEDLQQEIEQRHLKMQRGLTKQLETMSRAVLQEADWFPGGENTLGASLDHGEGASLAGWGKPARRRPAGRSGLGIGADFDLSAVESPRLTPARTYSPRGLSSSLHTPGPASRLG